MIQQFDIFAQLVATGSISASAKALNIQPADVLMAMDQLESRLGYALFQMEGEQVTLTPTGQKLVRALGSLSLAEQERWISSILGETNPDDHDAITNEADALRHNGNAADDALLLTVTAPPPLGGANKRSFSDIVGEQMERIQLPPLTNGASADDHSSLHSQTDLAPDAIRTILPFPTPAMPTTIQQVQEDAPAPSFQRPRPATRTITLASHPAIFSHFQEALLAFEQASPDINITLRLDNISASDINRMFNENLADIAYFHALDEVDGLDSRYAWSERISLFVGDGHPLTQMQAAMADDLTAFPYIALAPGNPARLLAEEALARNGLTVGPAIIETDDLYDIMRQVQEKPCYFAAFGSMARDFGKMRGISRIAYAQGLPQVQVRQAVRYDLAHDPVILALSEFLFR